MSEPNIKELLEEQMKIADDFPRANFGLKVGHDFPDIARAVLTSEVVCTDLLFDFVMTSIKSAEVSRSVGHIGSFDAIKVVGKNPILYELALKYLYFGIQIGRLQEKQVSEALQSIAKGEGQ